MFIIRKVLGLFLALVNIICTVCGGGTLGYMKSADVDIRINENKTYQTTSGFGTSSCWWSQYAGNTDNADEIARLLYSSEGLGLNIYRYNVGGGEADNPNARVRGSRASESFYYYNESTKKYEYDFTRDAGAQKMLEKSLSYGLIDTVVLFANSPHYSMTASGSAAGSYSDFTCNLPRENFEAYADYFITITKHFLDNGVPVKYISPINEPQWSWGGGWVGQEGCHYETQDMIELYRVFAKKIKASGLNVKLSAPESGNIGDTTDNWFKLLREDADIAPVLGNLAYHSYWADSNAISKYQFGKDILKSYSDIEVEMSEWCELPCVNPIDSIDGALRMAKVICQDMALTNVNSWTSWVAMNGIAIGEDGKSYSDGLLASTTDQYTDYTIAMRYWALAHFSKFIPAGSVRVKASDDLYDLSLKKLEDSTFSSETFFNCIAFVTPEDKTVLVVINEGETRRVNVCGIRAEKMSVYTTTQESQMKMTYDGAYTRATQIPAKSISTFVFD